MLGKSQHQRAKLAGIVGAIVLGAIVLGVLFVATSGASAKDLAKTHKLYPFKNLPGVQIPPDELKAEHACRTELRAAHGFGGGNHYASRVYVCDDGIMTYESTNVPMETDWRTFKNRIGK